MKKRNLLVLISFPLLTCLGTLYMIYSKHGKISNPSNKEQADAFMVNAHYQEFDKNGALHSTLTTPYITHFAYKNTTVFDKPRMMIYTDRRIPWHIAADQGKSHEGTHWVFLWGNVVLHQPSKFNHPDTLMKTESLTVYPNKSYAETDQKVTIKQPGSLIKGKGLKINMETGTATILAQSAGTYQGKKEK